MKEQSRRERIAVLVHEAQRGITAADIFRRLGMDGDYKAVVAQCHTMAQRGQLKKVCRLKPGTLRTVTYFLPVAMTVQVRRRWSPESLLRRTLVHHAGANMKALAWYSGLSMRHLRQAARTLLDAGEIEWVGTGNNRRLAIVEDDDAWTPPTHYIGATRAAILGLRPGRAA